MAVYQVSFLFNTEEQERATYFAESLKGQALSLLGVSGIATASTKISFTKFEKEQDAGE